MDFSQLGYSRTTTKPFAELLQSVQEVAAARGFRTLHVHDVQATIGEKGFDIAPYSIVEICNAGYAFQAISAFKPIGLMLPCRIVVYADGEWNVVVLMRPASMSTILPEADLGTLPDDVDAILRAVVDEVTA